MPLQMVMAITGKLRLCDRRRVLPVGNERLNGDGVMRMRSCDWIASVVLFVFAVLIILAFGFV
jgi:hypothetical protein